MPDDLSVNMYRGRIWNKPDHDYDSTWINMVAGLDNTLTLPLNIENTFIYYEQSAMPGTGYGINHAYYGGSFDTIGSSGSYWSDAYNQSIKATSHDSVADQARFRVYKFKSVANKINPAVIMYLLN